MLFGGKKIRELETEIAKLKQHLAELNGMSAIDVRVLIEARKKELDKIDHDIIEAKENLNSLNLNLIEMEEIALLQEVGIYRYRHPLDDVVSYQKRLKQNQDSIKELAKSGAVECSSNWEVNGSKKEGQKLARDLSKLMLRAYNSEADNITRTLKPHTLDSALKRIEKARETIEKLGRIIHLEISETYHQLHITDIELTADYLVKNEEEKDRQRQERVRQREEEKAQREFEAEKRRLEKEQFHYRTALERVRESGDQTAIKEMEEKIAQIESAIIGIERREANIRAGYVYVISNFGSFGDNVVKIGLTRRLDPLERVRELSDASVPFDFDVHAIIFSDDAVGLESSLHSIFTERRVNLINMRREYFYVSPEEVKNALISIGGQQLLEFTEVPAATEWRASINSRTSA